MQEIQELQAPFPDLSGAFPPLETKLKTNSPTTVWEWTAEISQSHKHNHRTLLKKPLIAFTEG